MSLLKRYRRWLVLAGSVVLILVLLPLVIQWGITRTLRQAGATEASLADVDFNPFAAELVIKGLNVRGGDAEGGSLERLRLNLAWWPLVKKRLHVEAVEVQGLKLDVQRTDSGEIRVAGLSLPAAEAEPPPLKEAEPQSDGGSPWGLRLTSFVLEDILLDYADPQLQQEIRIPRASVGEIATWIPESATPLNLELVFAGGELRVQGESHPFLKEQRLDVTLRLRDLGLSWVLPYLEPQGVTSVKGAVDLDLTFEARLGGAVPKLEGRSDLVIRELSVGSGEPPLDLSAERLQLENDFQLGAQESAGLEGVRLSGLLELAMLKLNDRGRQRSALKLESLNLENFRFEGPETLEFDRLALESLALLERSETESEKDAPFGLHVGKVALSGFSGGTEALQLDTLRVAEVTGRVHRDASGEIDLLLWQPESPPEQSDDGGAAAPQSQPVRDGEEGAGGPKLHLDEFLLEGENRLHFTDQSVSPGVDLQLSPLELRLAPIQNDPPKSSELSLRVGIGRYGMLELQGQIAPFAEAPTLHLEGELKGLDLPPFSPYAAQAAGYDLKQGHVGAELDLNVESGKVDSLIDLSLDKFELSAPPDGEVSGALGMSVDSALSLLRDRQGHIELEIPVEGDLGSPDVSLESLLFQATTAAVKKAAVGQFASLGVRLVTGVVLPPGTLFLAGKMVDYATTMRFDPLIYPPLVQEPSPEHRQFLENLAEILIKRPETKLALCGMAGGEDLSALRQRDEKGAEKKERPAGDKAAEPPPLSPVEDARLKGLAEGRALAAKDFLIERKIEAHRLLVCLPQVELDEPPQVLLSL